ncbi:MAG TPA: MOSC N-terminal beta barrel domain-containing protein, partial [Gaiellaceae bacterium]|nr:MOSC N-terminal beta barrel domain-containing protein [Gaiellaceae bacterium]
MRVVRIAIAPVKGLGLVHPDEVVLGRRGVAGDRRYYLIDPDGRLINNKSCGELMQIRPELNGDDRLALRFPDGDVAGEVALGDAVETSFYGRPVTGRLVDGPWSAAISEHAARPLRLVRADEPGDAIDRTHVVSVISDGSLRALAREAGVDDVDGRRFRMTFELEGCDEHEEDGWIGSEVEVGEARIRVAGPVGRCAVTTRNPDSGVSDLDTLRALAGYRTLREGKA